MIMIWIPQLTTVHVDEEVKVIQSFYIIYTGRSFTNPLQMLIKCLLHVSTYYLRYCNFLCCSPLLFDYFRVVCELNLAA